MIKSRLQTALAVIPVASAGLYLLGFSYHQSYLAGFGIEDSLFPLAADKLLLFGFYAFVTIGFGPFVYVLLTVFLLFMAVVFAAILSSTNRVKNLKGQLISKLRSFHFENSTEPTMSALVDKSGNAYVYLTGSFLVFLLLIVITVLAEQSGKAQSQKDIEAFKNKNGKWTMLHTAMLSEPTRAMQIICGTSHCAFWLGDETLILRHENIERIVAHRP